uniref:Uncharacterized protein n=1 Tax=Panagrolaimus superbus TaxID=310955 RepID=A0A914YTS9_9BILA
MIEIFFGTIVQIIFLGICINFTLIFCTKKKPVEDLMARPKFTAPATTARTSTEVRKINNNNNGKPNVEHTISIKLDNNADDDDMQGPRESMSRDPMTELPGTQKPKVVIQEDFDPDKGAETPPSNLQWDPNKDTNKEKSSKKPIASPMAKDRSQSKRKRQRTIDLEATQEFKHSKEETDAPSKKPLSLKSARSGNLKRKSKSKPKNGNNNKSHRTAFSVRSIKTQGTTTCTRQGGRTAQSPNCISRNREDRTKEVESTQDDVN